MSAGAFLLPSHLRLAPLAKKLTFWCGFAPAVEQVISNVEQEGERELAVMVKEDFDTTDSNARYLGECRFRTEEEGRREGGRTSGPKEGRGRCEVVNAPSLELSFFPRSPFEALLTSSLVFTAYGNRLRTALRASSRYVAYVALSLSLSSSVPR